MSRKQHAAGYVITTAVYVVFALCCGPATHAQTPIHQIDSVTVKTYRNITNYKQDRIIINPNLIDNSISTTAMADPIALLQLMPGIQTTGEVNSGIYVRGSHTSQNHILLDNATIYNPSHLMGIFSVFNMPALKDFSLDKSYISPQFGGRISGLIQANTKDNIPANFTMRADIGIIASSLATTIPIGEKFMINAALRVSYVNPILRLIANDNSSVNTSYDFWDANFSAVYTPTNNDKLKLSSYVGADNFDLANRSISMQGNVSWSNRTISLNWTHNSVNQQNKRSFTFYTTNYDNRILINQFIQSLFLPNKIRDYGLNASWYRHRPTIDWKWGAQTVYHIVTPQIAQYNGISSSPINELVKSLENGLWGEAEIKTSDNTKLSLGLRLSSYVETQASCIYNDIEPRADFQWSVSPQTTLNVSYIRSTQNLRQVSVTSSGLPSDFWIATNEYVPPLKSHNINLGCNVKWKSWEFAGTIYFKYLRNEIESSASLMQMYNQQFNLYQHLILGNGSNYGLELYLSKTSGRLKGWISYTLGFAPRKFDHIDNGQIFEATYNRRHDLSISVQYNILKNFSASAVFVLASGTSYTPVESIYLIGVTPVNQYGPHNSAQLPLYNRLDISMNYHFNTKKLSRSTLKLALYNVYGRENPVMKYDFMNYDNQKVSVNTQYISLYSFIPSISYIAEF